MGKDQELLDAARNGNVSVVEKILNQRAKRSGPLASLRRGPGANVQDNSGYTPLHHACLNGHKEIVTLLLIHDASPNVVDHKGSSSLHLAAWTGNTDIVKLLLVQSGIQPHVNLTNHDKETPLHSAAQYGHVEVVSQLLQYEADPTIRNLKEESPLDLAAQYGRLETVEVLVRARPELLTSTPPSRKHSPLHLASRNGHRHVVQILVSAGFNINTRTETGSALHEASTFGKVDVVRLLLENGIDLRAEDSQHRTVLEILDDLKANKSQEIATVIRNHISFLTNSDYDYKNANRCLSNNYRYENVVLPKSLQRASSASMDSDRRISGGSSMDVYQIPPAPRSLESSLDDMDLSTASSDHHHQREMDSMSIGSSYYETPLTPRGGGHGAKSYLDHSPFLYQVPPAPREVKRMSDPVERGGEPRTQLGPMRNSTGDAERHMSPMPSYVTMIASHTPSKVIDNYLRPPQKPPRKSMSPHSPTKPSPTGHEPVPGAYEYLCLSTSGLPATLPPPSMRFGLNGSQGSIGGVPNEYVEMKLRHSFVLPNDIEVPPEFTDGDETILNSNPARWCPYENVTLRPPKMPKPTTLQLQQWSLNQQQHVVKNAAYQQQSSPSSHVINQQGPLSPTTYDQPPTPDFPPPSPGTAESGIHLKIRPLSQEYKRRSKDMETLTEDEDFELTADVNGIRLVPIKKENKSVCTETGTMDDTSSGTDTCSDNSVNVPLRHSPNFVRNDYENVAPGVRKESFSILSPFDENAEWAKIADITASFGGIFCRGTKFGYEHEDLQNHRHQLGLSNHNSHIFQTPVGQWLNRIGLGEYESLFLSSGYDDIEFMGLDVLDDHELMAMGVVHSEHRKRILTAAAVLPCVPPVQGNVKGQTKIPDLTVDRWLKSIHLNPYIEIFRKNKYEDMERVLKMWEVELVTVLEVTIPGHKKRILASLGERPVMPNLEEFKRLDSELNNLKNEIDHLGNADSTHGTVGTNTLKRRGNGVRKNAPPPPPPPRRSSSLSPCDPENSIDLLKLRNPSELFSGIPNSLTTRWRHRTNQFITESCLYLVQYFGTSPVHELKGVESTRTSLAKLKKSALELKKLPRIVMAINFRGVKLIDADTQKIVVEHDIRNINCACQDADDLDHFAYITKDSVTQKHFCHVFGVETMDVAMEIILTLGQAFEIAYQMALRESVRKATSPSSMSRSVARSLESGNS